MSDIGKDTARNSLGPPSTDPNYGLALAMENLLSSYDYIVGQPSVLNHEQGERFLALLDDDDAMSQ